MLDASDPEFLLTRPEDMRSALFELTHPDSHILVRDAADREMAVLVLGADKQTRQFFWRPRDYAGADFEQSDSMGLLSGTTFHFHATAYGGVQIRFRVQRPEVIHFDDGSAALMSPFPDRLARIQRRKMFRASLVTGAGQCRASWQPDAKTKPFQFTVRDISVDGVGLRAALAVPELPERGTVLEDVQLDFGELGKLSANLEVRNIYPISGQPMIQPDSPDDAAPRHVSLTGEPPMSHMGAVFLNLDARQENWLQKVVWRLEKGAQRN
ncbi:Predicted glycosyltransferase [Achromobacter spanius]|uniref:flagellar brake protein n=1 Tax=Achromobacter spanius TaxID=217203 RepID=UPI000C2BB4F7|nr:flagellar brake protein [Achromobacter spanius]AUA57568.1 flagellar brake protein [Achromobacter spanius]CAB3628089.1 Flagellar brake protein YcgR [Achromobacter spanius]SPT37376.1 Predicted glycosyltransferase [Achromobacter denitrificans]VEE54701.1 Predicted glycosyltransferase [Achromobacter spanius]